MDSNQDSKQAKQVFKDDEVIRIVMVGKTGAGKSATGNTILGDKCFKSEFCPQSLTTDCEKAYGKVDGQWVAVIDTPGLFDTRNTEEKTDTDIAQCIAYACPGPHIFLIIIKLDIFTEEEKKSVEKIQKIFGKEANKYSMILFTHGDLLKGKPIKEVLEKSEDLKEIVAKCNGHYHVFNNEVEDCSQVSELIEKIREINVKNGATYYTTEVFKEAERIIEKLMKKLEEKWKGVKGDREGQSKLEEEKLRESQEHEARRLAERRDNVLQMITSLIPLVTSICSSLFSRK